MAVSLLLVAEAAAGPAQPEDAREKAEKRDCVERAQSLFGSQEIFCKFSKKKGKREKARNILVGSIVLAQASSCGRCREDGVVI